MYWRRGRHGTVSAPHGRVKREAASAGAAGGRRRQRGRQAEGGGSAGAAGGRPHHLPDGVMLDGEDDEAAWVLSEDRLSVIVDLRLALGGGSLGAGLDLEHGQLLLESAVLLLERDEFGRHRGGGRGGAAGGWVRNWWSWFC